MLLALGRDITHVRIIFLAVLFHLLLDIFEHCCYYRNMHWIRKWSIVYTLVSAQSTGQKA